MTYSNCLLEAIFAKLRDPKHIRIIRFPRLITRRLHFGWTDGVFFYHAYDFRFHKKNIVRRNLELFYRIKIKKVPWLTFEAYLCDKLKGVPEKGQKKLLKKLGVHLADIPYAFPEDRWNWVFDDSDLPREEDVRYMEKLFRGNVFIKVVKRDKYLRVCAYEEVMKIKARNGWGWRYITQADGTDFMGLYGFHIRVRNKEIED